MALAATLPLIAGCSGADGDVTGATTSGVGTTTTGATSGDVPTSSTATDATSGVTSTGVTSVTSVTSGETGDDTTGASTTGDSTTGDETTGDGTTGDTEGLDFDPEAGWTELKPSADTRKVYVSSSMGDNMNDGLSEAKPVKTLAKAYTLLRHKYPDWMLLRRGDVWSESLPNWNISGRDEDEPMVVSTYGDAPERPRLETGSAFALYLPQGKTADYLSVVGLHFYSNGHDPDSPDYAGSEGGEGVRWVGNSKFLLLEDLVVESYNGSNLTFGGNVSDVKLRRSIIIDAWNVDMDGEYDPNIDEHSQGFFASSVDRLLIEENLFDHNGYREGIQGAEPTEYNHDIYIQVDCTGLVVRGNIITRASSHGLQARPGGLVERNLFVDNPTGLSYGLVNGTAKPKPGGVNGLVYGNVIRDSGDITAALPRGFGIKISNIASAVVEDNIFAHDKATKSNYAAILMEHNGVDVVDLKILNNIIFDWRGGIKSAEGIAPRLVVAGNQVQSPMRPSLLANMIDFDPKSTFTDNEWFSISPDDAWFQVGGDPLSLDQWVALTKEDGAESVEVDYPDPERTLGDYHGSLGKDPSFTAYLAEARKQSRKNYKLEYTARGAIAFIRAGFGRSLESPPTPP